MDKEQEKKSDKIVIIIIGIVLFLLILIGLIYNKSLETKEKQEETNKKITTTTIKEDLEKYELSEEQKDGIITEENQDGTQDLYINNFKIETDMNGEYHDFKKLNDRIIFNVSDADIAVLYSADEYADNVINLTSDIDGEYYGNYEIKNDSIYVTTYKLGQDPKENACNSKAKEKVILVTKITYKDGSYNKKLESYVTAEEYIEQENLTCNK